MALDQTAVGWPEVWHMRTRKDSLRTLRWGKRGFSLPELLIVIGIIALLMAILVPPLQIAHHHAATARCAAQQKQIGHGLNALRDEYQFYPVWDDASGPIRFTWIDVLVETRHLADCRAGYCPEDPAPGPVASARGHQYNLIYPRSSNGGGPSGKPDAGIDYSFGISVPLSAAGWAWRPGFGSGSDDQPHRLDSHDRYPGQRVLAADANWSGIYNLGTNTGPHGPFYPTQYDNTVEYRHPNMSANLLMQDGHVERVKYQVASNEPINTAIYFVWHPGESLRVVPGGIPYQNNLYPNEPPVDVSTGDSGSTFPRQVVPGYYTHNRCWTQIFHK